MPLAPTIQMMFGYTTFFGSITLSEFSRLTLVESSRLVLS